MKPFSKGLLLAITIYDVAKKAGVGIGTVSRALNDSPHILPETKAKILRVVKELNYTPHVLARGLASKRTNTITIIIPTLPSHYYYGIISGIQDESLKNNYDLILHCADNPKLLKHYFDKTLKERKVDCVIILSHQVSNQYAEKYLHAKIPVILVDSFHPQLDSIYTENQSGAFTAVEHLIKNGHKKIGFITGLLKSVPAKQRLQGYKKALRKYGIGYDKRIIIECDFVPKNDGFNEEAGYMGMKKMLDLNVDSLSAVFVASDIQAIGVLNALQESKIRVPEEISVVGFDDIEISKYLGLSTMRQPIYSMGKLAVLSFIERNGSKNRNILKKVFKSELIVRRSSDFMKN
jgi:LacI family transcriptional regulator